MNIGILETYSRDVPVFEWGKVDCCMWTSDIQLAIHGKDYAKKYRGTYTSEKTFKRMLVKNKFKNLEDLVLDLLGEPKIAGLARLGDPMLLEEQGVHIVGVCYGTYALFLTQDGFTSRRLSACKYTWNL